jgi:hypothetical protein
MDQNGKINHNFGKWASCDVLRKNSAWIFYIQPSSGILFSKTDNDNHFLYTIAMTNRKNYANCNIDGEGHQTQQLPTDCIPSNLRMNRKKNLLVATFNNSKPTENHIMKAQPNWQCCFIENTIVTDRPKLQTILSRDKFTIFIASDGGVYNYDGTFRVAISDGNSILAKNNGKFYSVHF